MPLINLRKKIHYMSSFSAMAEPSNILVWSCQYQLVAEVKKIEKGPCYSYSSREKVLEVLIRLLFQIPHLGRYETNNNSIW